MCVSAHANKVGYNIVSACAHTITNTRVCVRFIAHPNLFWTDLQEERYGRITVFRFLNEMNRNERFAVFTD